MKSFTLYEDSLTISSFDFSVDIWRSVTRNLWHLSPTQVYSTMAEDILNMSKKKRQRTLCVWPRILMSSMSVMSITLNRIYDVTKTKESSKLRMKVTTKGNADSNLQWMQLNLPNHTLGRYYTLKYLNSDVRCIWL